MPRIPGIAREVFPVNLGGNPFGWTATRETSFMVMDSYAAWGGNFIDTADGYCHWVGKPGISEQIIGEWLRDRHHRREDFVIATKVSSHPDFRGLAPDTIARAAEASLRRLGTDHIDLYYAHHDDATQSVPDMAVAFDALVRAGKIRAIGLSNLSPARMREWLEFARLEQLSVPVAMQPHYSLVHRQPFERDYAPIAREFGLAVFPYYALAGGFLTGKYRQGADVTGRARSATVGKYLTEEGLRVVEALTRVAEVNRTEPATVALAWLLSRGMTAPIASASHPAQVPALTRAATLALTSEELGALDRASAPFAQEEAG